MSPAQSNDQADADALAGLQSAWMQAWIDRDRPTLEAILDEDFVLTVSANPSAPVTRSRWLAATETYLATDFSYDWMHVRLFGDMAVVASTATQTASVGGQDRSGTFFLTDVWRKTDGRWRVAARHSSRPETGSDSSEKLLERP